MSPKNLIPRHEERLREVILVSIQMMMNVMVRAVVREQEKKYISREAEPAMIIDSLHGGEGEEED